MPVDKGGGGVVMSLCEQARARLRGFGDSYALYIEWETKKNSHSNWVRSGLCIRSFSGYLSWSELNRPFRLLIS